MWTLMVFADAWVIWRVIMAAALVVTIRVKANDCAAMWWRRWSER